MFGLTWVSLWAVVYFLLSAGLFLLLRAANETVMSGFTIPFGKGEKKTPTKVQLFVRLNIAFLFWPIFIPGFIVLVIWANIKMRLIDKRA